MPATIASTGRQVLLHLATKVPWADLVNDAVHRLRALAVSGYNPPTRPDTREPRPPGTGDQDDHESPAATHAAQPVMDPDAKIASGALVTRVVETHPTGVRQWLSVKYRV